MKMLKRRAFLGSLLLVAGVLVANLARAQFAPSTSDLWDVSNGNVVTANSGLLVANGGADVRELFGFVRPTSAEPGALMFEDAQAAGFVHYVEWSTPTANTVASVVLNARHDGSPYDANERGFSQFRLYARNPSTSAFDILVFQYSPSNPYSASSPPPNGLVASNATGDVLQLCANVTPITASDFRAEFVQYGDRTALARGPRIIELDAFADARCTAAPAAPPAQIPTLSEWALMLLAILLAMGGFVHFRRQS